MKLNLGSLFGDRDMENMFGRIDALVDGLASKKRVDNEKDISDVALREILKSIDSDGEGADSTGEDSQEVQKLLDKLSISPARLQRYKIYDELYSAVQLLKRIVAVYLNNTLQRDVLTGKSIDVKENEDKKDDITEVQYYKDFSNRLIEHYGIEKELKDKIANHILRYGDHFVEIIDLQDDVSNLPDPNSQQVITENTYSSEAYHKETVSQLTSFNKSSKSNKYNDKVSFNNCVDRLFNTFVEVKEGVSSRDHDVHGPLAFFQESIKEQKVEEKVGAQPQKDRQGKSKKKDETFDRSKFNRLIFRYHKPHHICVLRTEYGSVIGFVEIKDSRNKEVSPGVGMQFANVLQQMGTSNKAQSTNSIIKGIINRIVKDVIKKLDVKKEQSLSKKSKYDINKDYEMTIRNQLGDDLFFMMKKLFVETNDQANFDPMSKKISVRFISKDRIVSMTHNSIEYFPYGTSVLDALVYPGKLYMLTQLTNVVTKLSRAALIRKWTIETGPREHHTGLIQKLKRELRNQRVTVEDLVSFKSVPKVLSDFKDVILLSKKGQRFVDMDLQQMHDANIKVQDLEDTRREIIALSGVPAPYLGYNDVIELREQLVHVNITFATEIIAVQSSINTGITDIVDRVGGILGVEDKPSRYVKLSLRPPVVLLLQMIETVMASITNIQQNFQATQIEFNPYYLLKRYLPSINWEEFSKEAKEFELFKKAQGPNNGEEGGQF
jgi:hypothetical protein